MAKKQAAAADAYKTGATRFDREKRLTDMLDDDK